MSTCYNYSAFCLAEFFLLLQALESFYDKFDSEFIDIRTKAREVLQREDDLNEIVQVCIDFSVLSLPGF